MAESKLKPQAVDAQLIPAAAQTTTAKARAYRSSNFTLPNVTETVIPFNAVNYDPGSNFNTGNGRFTAPVSGWYMVHSAIRNDGMATGKRMDMGLLINGSETSFWLSVPSGSGAESGINGGDIKYMSAGDYLETKASQDKGTSVILYGGSSVIYTAIHLISI